MASVEPVTLTLMGSPPRHPSDPERIRVFTEQIAPQFLARGLEIVDLLAEGANTRVYRVRDRKSAEIRALRVYKPPGECRKFKTLKRNALVFRWLRHRLRGGHPNVVALLKEGTARVRLENRRYRLPYMVMEHLEGRTLRSRILSGDLVDLSLPGALDVLLGVTDGVAFFRERGLRHGDVLPQNIVLVQGQGGVPVPKLTDLAPRRRNKKASRSDHLKLYFTWASTLMMRRVMDLDPEALDPGRVQEVWGWPTPSSIETLCDLVRRIRPGADLFDCPTAEVRVRLAAVQDGLNRPG